jgi:hypothetical protein
MVLKNFGACTNIIINKNYIKYTQYPPQKTQELNQISEQISKDLLHKLNIEMSVA